jgi:RNA polymerase sigma factor (sigma-70 family)
VLEQENIIEQLRSGDRSLLNQIYEEYRGKFLGWAAKQFNADDDIAIEIYQEAVVTLYENIYSNKLQDITTTVQSYLFAIGRNKFLERTRFLKKFENVEDDSTIETVEEESVEDDNYENEHQKVGIALKEMGPPCKTLLQYFYYEKKNMDEIASLMDYKNPATAKNQKYKCLQRLKKMVFENK